MIRDFQIQEQKAVVSTFKASANMQTGAAVVKNYTNGTAGFPAANTAKNIFFADKERIPAGTKAAASDLSDYDTGYTAISTGEYVKLRQYGPGERFAIDAFNASAAPNAGDVIEFSTSGQAIAAAANNASAYLCINNNYSDAGHRLLVIEVLQDALTHA